MLLITPKKKKTKYSYIMFLKSINHIRLLCVIKYVVSLTFSTQKKKKKSQKLNEKKKKNRSFDIK